MVFSFGVDTTKLSCIVPVSKRKKKTGEPEASGSEQGSCMNNHLRSAARSRQDANRFVLNARCIDAARHPDADKLDLGAAQGKLVASMSVLQLSKNNQMDLGTAMSHVDLLIHVVHDAFAELRMSHRSLFRDLKPRLLIDEDLSVVQGHEYRISWGIG
jgi:hypothetical protein